MGSTQLPVLHEPHSPRVRAWLRVGQALGVMVLALIAVGLVISPTLALKTLWFACIPLAPLLLLVVPNIWVSVCPISTLQVLPRRLGIANAGALSPQMTQRLQLAGWIAMFAGIPTRHLGLNTEPLVLLGALLLAASLAVAFGESANGLSGWCVGLCPVRPIEVVYGQFAIDRRRPEKCTDCHGCIASCQRLQPERSGREFDRSSTSRQLLFALPGFIAAYFALDLLGLCIDERRALALELTAPRLTALHVITVYGTMAIGGLISWGLFRWLDAGRVARPTLYRAAAIAAYCCYYLGVLPEIGEVWHLSFATLLGLALLPLASLLAALFGRPSALRPA